MQGKAAPLCVTLGDPDGLGPEIACRALGGARRPLPGGVVLLGPEAALRRHCELLSLRPFWRRVSDYRDVAGEDDEVLLYEPPGLAGYEPTPGKGKTAGGRAAGVCLDAACALALDGVVRGVVTMPLNKAMLQEAGYRFSGHTEFLAQRAGLAEDDVCMHLAGPSLRVSLVTTHPPLRQVPDLLSVSRILRCLQLTAECLLLQGLEGSIGVCGLNPHAGESGTIGTEEAEVIGPAVELAREHGVAAVGPLPADTIFHRASNGDFAAVLAMYHDQGLAPLKYADFGRAVNVTLGLPFVRTSVDHGVGYDLAGRNLADISSFEAAMNMARALAP